MRYLVQAGVELQDLQGAYISHDKPVLHTGSLCSIINYDQIPNTMDHKNNNNMNLYLELPNMFHLEKFCKVDWIA